MPVSFPFENIYAKLPSQCFEPVQPTPVSEPELIKFNESLADTLNIETTDVTESELAAIFSGNAAPDNAIPLAMAYSGHQFGNLNPQLGDGRAILLGDLYDKNSQLRDVQLKGAGRTPFSRGGDGRSPLGPALREYILCEAMFALGVPTTRALALVRSGETVIRQQREPGAVFTRVAASHIRVGTFQYFALRRDHDALRALADHVINRHYREVKNTSEESEKKYLNLFKKITENQAKLIAKWMNLGFIHGVMNTDNMTVSGETIDYGPCAFIDSFNRKKVFSSIDQQGRYAYINQPAIGQWNLTRLAEAMLPLFMMDTESAHSSSDGVEATAQNKTAQKQTAEKQAIEDATQVLNDYAHIHQRAWETGMAAKLGFSEVQEGDRQRFEALTDLLDETRVDYTLFFRRLSSCVASDGDLSQVLDLLNAPEARSSAPLLQQLKEWIQDWQGALAERESLSSAQQRMNQSNPAIIPRNHQVQRAISAAESGDYEVFEKLLSAVTRPYEDNPEHQEFKQPPEPAEQVLRTFCGT
ncbi:YdiU family protein [Thalassolituus sp.]|uniref:protein adenylyltransferase SelO n=1 Tax=Thalassolituus sp. TaxID=2030822 RepID=UPI00351961CE